MTSTYESRVHTLQLVAVKRGFYGGRLVERGQEFTFTGAKLPSWAIRAGLPLPPVPHADFNGDTKPLASQQASRVYQAGFGVGDLP